MKPVRIALIGAGYWGSKILKNLKELGVLAAYVDEYAVHPDVPRRSLESVLQDREIDAVIIATPSNTHAALARAALEHGKHVCVEKPLCLSAEESDALSALAKQRGLILMVGYLMMFHPVTQFLRDAVRGGVLSDCDSVLIQRQDWTRVRAHESVWWDLAVHDVSMLWAIFQQVPRHLSVSTHRMSGYGGDSLYYEGVLTRPEGQEVKVYMHTSWIQPIKSVAWTLTAGDRLFSFRGDQEFQVSEWVVGASEPMRIWDLGADFPLSRECGHFIECIQKDQTPYSDAAETRAVMGWLQSLEYAVKS